MLIGELATRVDVTTKTLRFYEGQGLLPPPLRTPAGYRDYDEHAVGRVRFVRSAQAAGFTLREIAAVLAARDRGEAPCEHVQGLITRHLEDIDRRLGELRRARDELRALAAHARTVSPRDCPPESICRIIAA